MLTDVVTSAMCQGVLNEVVGLLPTIIPVTISFIAVRKGLSFLIGALHSA